MFDLFFFLFWIHGALKIASIVLNKSYEMLLSMSWAPRMEANTSVGEQSFTTNFDWFDEIDCTLKTKISLYYKSFPTHGEFRFAFEHLH